MVNGRPVARRPPFDKTLIYRAIFWKDSHLGLRRPAIKKTRRDPGRFMSTNNHPSRDQIRIEDVLNALGHPLRMTVLKVLADGAEHSCGSILRGASKSTMTHHWRVLRDAGVIWRRPYGRENLLSLRKEDLDWRFPGLLDSLLRAIREDPLTKEMVLSNQAGDE